MPPPEVVVITGASAALADIWVNNAMVSVFSPIKEMTADEFRRVTEVTYLSAVHATAADAGAPALPVAQAPPVRQPQS